MYEFDFSAEGVGRLTGYIVLVGINLEVLDFGIPDENTLITTEPDDDPSTKIRRLH
jgi:hypothetical protein